MLAMTVGGKVLVKRLMLNLCLKLLITFDTKYINSTGTEQKFLRIYTLLRVGMSQTSEQCLFV